MLTAAVAALLLLVGLPGGTAQAAGVYDAIPQSDLRNLVTAMEGYAGFTSPDGTFRGVTAQALADEGWTRTSTDAVSIKAINSGSDFVAFAQDVRGSSEYALMRYGPGSFHGVSAGGVGISSPQPAQPAWDPATGSTRTWHETVDGNGRIRQVRPETGGSKKHHTFDENGNYTGSW